VPESDDFRDFDDPSMGGPGPAPGPLAARIAGWLWLVVGAIALLEAVLHLFVNVIAVIAQRGPFSSRDPLGCFCGMAFAVGFLVVGTRTLQGKAAGIVLSGIVSLVCAPMFGCMSCFTWSMTVRHVNPAEQAPVLLLAGISATVGAILVAAGIFALVGWKSYEKWRASQGFPTPWSLPGDDYDGPRRSRRRRRVDENE
jgi:hypothetical protein